MLDKLNIDDKLENKSGKDDDDGGGGGDISSSSTTIATITNINTNDININKENDDQQINLDDIKERERALEKRKYVLLELIDTEKDYVQHLGMIVDGYIQLIRNDTNDYNLQVPDDLKGGKYKIIFGNLENIYEWHKE